MDIEIPYNVKERKDTGLYNSKLGMWLFLASEVMLFGALFSSGLMEVARKGIFNPGEFSELINFTGISKVNLDPFVILIKSI